MLVQLALRQRLVEMELQYLLFAWGAVTTNCTLFIHSNIGLLVYNSSDSLSIFSEIYP